MQRQVLIAALVFAGAAFGADPKPVAPQPAAAAVFAPSRLPGQSIEEVMKAYPSAKESSERCHHEAVQKARIDCTRLAARSGNLGYQLEFTRAGILIRSAEYAIVKDAAEGQRLYRQRVEALTRAFGKGKENKSSPGEGLSEVRTAWANKPSKQQRAGVVLITKPNEPALVLDYIETTNPAYF